jgi:hypothetical protein
MCKVPNKSNYKSKATLFHRGVNKDKYFSAGDDTILLKGAAVKKVI